ncbi:MAG: tetratricopeptide repeat protein [Bacteroidales bacterium]|nr:tetratricopeptide repeat protein [Bacteroidales bacterium]
MPDQSDNPSNFWQELKRRRVIRIIPVYAASAFVILELVDIIAEPLGLPDWTLNMVLVLLVIGFVISVILSWVYDFTPEGIQKTEPLSGVKTGKKEKVSTGWRISTYVSVLIIIAFILFYVLSSIKKSSEISTLEKSIAVLPFENWNSDEKFMHLGDAITDEIIMQLQYIQEFDRVLSRSSTMQYKDRRPSITEIGKELGVNYIVEGSIQRQDDNVNIRVQVLRTIEEDHVWAEEYDGKWSDIYTIQNDIAKNVAKELKVVLTQSEIEQIERTPTDNLEAYNYYLQGNNYYWRSQEERDWILAINMYQKAIELDSNFVEAYTKLARSHISLYWYYFDRTVERLDMAKEAIDKAFDIKPHFADAHHALGVYYYHGFLDYDNALTHLKKALELNPNDAECIFHIAGVYRRMGNWQKAEEEFLKAFKSDPKNSRVVYNTAETFYLVGKYSEALDYVNMTIELNPEYTAVYNQKIKIYLKWEGETVKAREVFEEASLHINPLSNQGLVLRTISMDIYDGKYEDAINILNKIDFEALQSQFYYYPKYLYSAFIYDYMNDTGRAEHYYNLSRIMLEDKIIYFPDDSRLYSALGISYAGLGQKDKAIEAGKRAVELMPIEKEAYKGYYHLMELAQIYVTIGEYQKAINQLDFLLSVPGELSPALIQLETRWQPLWNLPEFSEMIDKYSTD